MSNLKEMHAKILAKAWKDPAFKKKLLSHPNEALKELGGSLPEGKKVRVIEENADTVTFILTSPPKNAGSLSEKELEKLAAAGGSFMPDYSVPYC